MKKTILAIATMALLASCNSTSTEKNYIPTDSMTLITTDTTVGTVVDSVKVDSVKVTPANTIK